MYTADGRRWQQDTYLVRARGAGTAVIPEIGRITRATIPDIQMYENGIATLEPVNGSTWVPVGR